MATLAAGLDAILAEEVTALPLETIAERAKKRRRSKSTAQYFTVSHQKRPKASSKHNSIGECGEPGEEPIPGAWPTDAMQTLTPPRSEEGVYDDEDSITLATPGSLSLARRYTISDTDFAAQVMVALQYKLLTQADSIRKRQMKRMVQLLQVALPPSQEDGTWLSEQDVDAYLRPGVYHEAPVFLKNQQPMPLMSVEHFVAEFYNDDAGVWIQDPSVTDYDHNTREVRIGDVKHHLRENTTPDYPWNCLEMAAPFEEGSRPKFLHSEECRLLTKIKIPNPELNFRGAKVGRRYLISGYKEAEKWVLLAQAGALTEPHQDSHGYNTYITVNEGILGFGWLHKPTQPERKQWIKNPTKFIKASWRYRVLRPGDTVYFPARTVHFVFRHPDLGHTLAFGGHVLRCSTIVQWLQALKDESTSAEVTNEELTHAAYGYVEQVGTFVEQALSSNPSTLDRWGGKESVRTFLKLKKDLLKRQHSAGHKD